MYWCIKQETWSLKNKVITDRKLTQLFILPFLDAIEAMDEEESSSRPALSRSLTRSLSRSFRFRNWFPWLSSRIAMGASGTASELNAGAVTNTTTITSTTDVQMRSHHPSRPPVNPMWRHSNPDSHYGFRVGPPIPQQSSGGMYTSVKIRFGEKKFVK